MDKDFEKLFHEFGHAHIAEYFHRKYSTKYITLSNPKVIVDILKIESYETDKVDFTQDEIETIEQDIIILLAGRLSQYKYLNKLQQSLSFCALIYSNRSKITDIWSDDFKIFSRVDILKRVFISQKIKTNEMTICMDLVERCLALLNDDIVWKKIQESVDKI